MLNLLLPDIASFANFYPHIDNKALVITHLAVAGIVFKRACWLCFAEPFCITGLLRPFYIYNGWDRFDELIVIICAAQQGRDGLQFRYPLYCNKGLYVNWGLVTQTMTVGYVPDINT